MVGTDLLPSGSTLGGQGLAGLTMGIQRQTRRDMEQVQRRAILAKLTEDGRAHLANTALEHVGALTALEQHLISIAPLGEPPLPRARRQLHARGFGGDPAVAVMPGTVSEAFHRVVDAFADSVKSA